MLLVAAWLFATAGAACAQRTEAGRFLSVSGDVRIVDREGAPRQAARAGEFYEGESIVTGPGALGQLRMADGALMSVRADTEMKLERFSFTGQNDPNPGFLLSVVKGGFRTITGLIGKIKRESYRVATPSATLGIRGTDFELVHVQQQVATPQAPAGTYNRVYDGVTSFQNIAGSTLLVSRDQTAFAALPGTTPPVLVAPPAAIFGRPTPPPSGPRSLREDDGKSEKTDTARQPAPGVRDSVRAAPVDTAPRLQAAPLLTPLETAPAILLTPIDTAPKVTTTTPIQTAPLLTPIDTAPKATTTILAPATTVAPVLTAPTTTVAPILTAPTTTVTPILTAPTTTITPILTAPTTTTTIKPTTILTPILK